MLLWDLDRQRSSLNWLAIRPADRPAVSRLDAPAGENGKDAKTSDWLILDTPAGLHGKNLSHAVKISDSIIVPLQPSIFDMAATSDFLQALVAEKAVRKDRTRIGVVGMRVDPRTKAAATLQAFLQQYRLPVLTYLRDTQLYANAAFNGLSIFDLPDHMKTRELELWGPLLAWLDGDNAA